jgi:hypothetical protein
VVPLMLCTPPSAVISIQAPTGPAHVDTGWVELKNGATFEVWGDGLGYDFIHVLRKGDRVEICYGPRYEHVAGGRDLGLRPSLIVNDETKGFLYTSASPSKRDRKAAPSTP